MNNTKEKSIHRIEALKLLEDGQPHNLKVWKMSNGEIITYTDTLCIGKRTRKGIHRVRVEASQQIREFRDCTLFEIDGLSVYM